MGTHLKCSLFSELREWLLPFVNYWVFQNMFWKIKGMISWCIVKKVTINICAPFSRYRVPKKDFFFSNVNDFWAQINFLSLASGGDLKWCEVLLALISTTLQKNLKHILNHQRFLHKTIHRVKKIHVNGNFDLRMK